MFPGPRQGYECRESCCSLQRSYIVGMQTYAAERTTSESLYGLNSDPGIATTSVTHRTLVNLKILSRFRPCASATELP